MSISAPVSTVIAPAPAASSLHARAGLTLALAVGLWLGGCATPSRTDPSVPDAGQISTEMDAGMASWYGERFHGKRTASGEAFNMNEFTAAHKTLPFGSQVRVRNLDNGQEVVVRINDRGPFTRGRVIDLSRAAAQAIGLLQTGTARVAVFRH
jgi:rare lipoprotein A